MFSAVSELANLSIRPHSSRRVLADIDAEFEQFAMDARCAPERVGRAHPADPVTDFGIRLGSTGAARSKALPMSSDHGRWFDTYHGSR